MAIGTSSALEWRRVCRAGGIAAVILIVYCIATMVQIAVLGGPPESAAEAFRLLHQNKLVGLLRLDFPTVIVLPFITSSFLACSRLCGKLIVRMLFSRLFCWHGTGVFVGGIFLQSGAVLISLVMLRSRVFSKTTAYVGIAMHGVYLFHIIFAPFLPATSVVLMMIAGPLYPVWLFLVGRKLLRC